MGILVFVVVIVVLIFVHELGHFIAAKLAGMRVDEFGLGYPPRALVLGRRGGTLYTLNWLPFGGFVKIYGEDGVREREAGRGAIARDPRAFGARPRMLQAVVLVAGVAMNLLLAYVLITGALVAGAPRALGDAEIARAQNVSLAVTRVLPGSPAERAGLAPGDTILSASDARASWDTAASPRGFTDFVSATEGGTIVLVVRRDGDEKALMARPVEGLIPSDPSRYALGVEVGAVGVLPLSLPEALVEGARFTWGATALTAEGLGHFLYGLATGRADFAQVAGPVGIAGVVGGAADAGLGDLLSIVAIISINLAIINLLPVPALDGGRLLVVAVEGALRRPLPAALVRSANMASFALLILLMLAVTAHDIYRIVS